MAHETAEKPRPAQKEPIVFSSLQREMNRLFDQFRVGLPTADILPSTLFGGGFPAIDVVDTGDAVEVTAELPGVSETDLDATISGDVLTLQGEKSYAHEEKEDSFHRIERRYGSFRRQVPLGFTPETGAVVAEFSDGVLKLTIPNPPAAQTEVQKIGTRKG